MLSSLVSLGSCRQVLIGDRIDAVGELCRVLEDCYGDDYRCEELQATLEQATPEARANFLSEFTTEACLGSCPSARVCLDLPPFCHGAGTCSLDQDCCGWSLGEASCQTGAGQCCKPEGVVCAEGDLCCDSECRNGTCGGVQCTEVGQKCESDTECCSHYCRGTTCSPKDCSLLNEDCQTAADCCPPDDAPEGSVGCDGNKCVLASTPSCIPTGEACGVSSDCCEGESCLGVFDGVMVYSSCGALECFAGASCTVEFECCQGFSCANEVSICLPPTTCIDLGAACGPDDSCCQGTCLGGTCAEVDCGLGIAPSEWLCPPYFYFDCDYCDCDCGVHDPDCDDPSLPVWCGGYEPSKPSTCNANDHCEPP